MRSTTLHPAAPRSRQPARRGFTLIEAAMATVIIGVGVLALIELLAAGTVSNVRGAEQTTAINMAKNIRELALQKTFPELQDMHNITHGPPVDSRGEPLSGMAGWSQQVKVESIDPNRLTVPLPDASPHAVRVTATVIRNSRTVCELSWFTFKEAP